MSIKPFSSSDSARNPESPLLDDLHFMPLDLNDVVQPALSPNTGHFSPTPDHTFIPLTPIGCPPLFSEGPDTPSMNVGSDSIFFPQPQPATPALEESSLSSTTSAFALCEPFGAAYSSAPPLCPDLPPELLDVRFSECREILSYIVDTKGPDFIFKHHQIWELIKSFIYTQITEGEPYSKTIQQILDHPDFNKQLSSLLSIESIEAIEAVFSKIYDQWSLPKPEHGFMTVCGFLSIRQKIVDLLKMEPQNLPLIINGSPKKEADALLHFFSNPPRPVVIPEPRGHSSASDIWGPIFERLRRPVCLNPFLQSPPPLAPSISSSSSSPTRTIPLVDLTGDSVVLSSKERGEKRPAAQAGLPPNQEASKRPKNLTGPPQAIPSNLSEKNANAVRKILCPRLQNCKNFLEALQGALPSLTQSDENGGPTIRILMGMEQFARRIIMTLLTSTCSQNLVTEAIQRMKDRKNFILFNSLNYYQLNEELFRFNFKFDHYIINESLLNEKEYEHLTYRLLKENPPFNQFDRAQQIALSFFVYEQLREFNISTATINQTLQGLNPPSRTSNLLSSSSSALAPQPFASGSSLLPSFSSSHSVGASAHSQALLPSASSSSSSAHMSLSSSSSAFAPQPSASGSSSSSSSSSASQVSRSDSPPKLPEDLRKYLQKKLDDCKKLIDKIPEFQLNYPTPSYPDLVKYSVRKLICIYIGSPKLQNIENLILEYEKSLSTRTHLIQPAFELPINYSRVFQKILKKMIESLQLSSVDPNQLSTDLAQSLLSENLPIRQLFTDQ